ncbi:Protein YIPF5 [Entamoeba marina]
MSNPDPNESDIIGSIIIAFALGIILLFNGKIRFGNIYGYTILATFVEYLVVNLLSNKNIDYLLIVTHFAYNIFPMMFLGIFLLFTDALSIPASAVQIIGWVFVLICMYACSKTINLLLDLPEKKFLLFYPVTMYYAIFMLFVVF